MTSQPDARLSAQLLQTARNRVQTPKACTEADLRRATSDLYYALFHAICEAVVEPLGADPENPAFVETYRAMYRHADHQTLEKRSKEALAGTFTAPCRQFAQRLIAMKNKRAAADYDPLETLSISDVSSDLDACEKVLAGFWAMAKMERSRLALFLTLDPRRNR